VRPTLRPLVARADRRRGMPSSQWAIGVDVGGTKVVTGLIDGDGEVAADQVAQTPHRSTAPRVVEDVIVAAVNALVAAAEADDIDPSIDYATLPIGVGAAGWIDSDRATIRFAPHLNWRDEPLALRLQARLGTAVTVENDANAAAWAEYRYGAARGESRVVMLTLGTGIGGGMVFDGALERGRHGMAGEFGHMTVVPGGRKCECGNWGCWEQYASGPALRREALEALKRGGPDAVPMRAAMRAEGGTVTGEMVTALAAAGDPVATDVVTTVGQWLGGGLANLVAALDPGLIVIGGGVSTAGELLLGPTRRALASHLSGRGHRPVPPVLGASLGPRAGMVGAADLARREALDGAGLR